MRSRARSAETGCSVGLVRMFHNRQCHDTGGQACNSDCWQDAPVHDCRPFRNLSTSRLVLMEFPSMEDAVGFYRSAEYSAAKALRADAATARFVVVEGYAPEAWEQALAESHKHTL